MQPGAALLDLIEQFLAADRQLCSSPPTLSTTMTGRFASFRSSSLAES